MSGAAMCFYLLTISSFKLFGHWFTSGRVVQCPVGNWSIYSSDPRPHNPGFSYGWFSSFQDNVLNHFITLFGFLNRGFKLCISIIWILTLLSKYFHLVYFCIEKNNNAMTSNDVLHHFKTDAEVIELFPTSDQSLESSLFSHAPPFLPVLA